MKEQVSKAIEAIKTATTIRGVSTAADTAYPNHQAPGNGDQKVLQDEVLKRKEQLRGPEPYEGCHSIACGALTNGPCTCR